MEEIKLKFRKQGFQERAAESVCEIFTGQPNMTTSFTIENHSAQGQFDFPDAFTMYGNHEIVLDESQILANLQRVQHNNGIKESDSLAGNIFTVEMETGTGKTYTYIRTIYELNKKYGWSKFIIVVPSIAIREGVDKTFRITESHFMSESEYKLRAGYFIYDSSNIAKINAFASDSGLKVMIINSQAFNARGQDARRIRMELDECNSRKPIDLIASVRPIVIIDEPQSVEGQKTKESLQEFNPLFTLRYSATPKEYYNLVYRLDALDAYEQKLVKRIKVTGFSLGNISASGSYVYLRGIIKSAKDPAAQIEFDRRAPSGELKRVTRILHEGDDLYTLSGGLDEYKDRFKIQTIDGLNGSVEFLNGDIINSGGVSGLLNDDELRRLQIRETIRSHIEKERQLFSMGVKVLSLFFIDEVAKYRKYNDDDESFNGIYAKIFEQEYNEAVKDFAAQIELDNSGYSQWLAKIEAARTHAGYFSVDKKNRMINSSDNKEDISAFDLIMKDKERLLSLDEPVRFIFSHSALREGWDNPNVFQICTLKNAASDIRRRQEVGRGLRLSVNQDGDRMDELQLGQDVQEVNELNIIASESYKIFAAGLQQELEESSGGRKGQVPIRDGRKRGVRVKLDESKMASPEFQELWGRINHRSVYSVDFNENEFIIRTAQDIDEKLSVAEIIVNIERGTLQSDGTFKSAGFRVEALRNSGKSIAYDLAGRLSKNTGLTRKVIVKILKKIGREKFLMFARNPEVFISRVSEIIRTDKAEFSSRKIKYIPLENESYNVRIFDDLTLREVAESSLADTHKTGLYDYAVCDSQVEKNFAEGLESCDDVALHVKLPSAFTITTPAGKYNPDWAITFRGKIYFVAETKGSTDSMNLRPSESAKIRCAKEHFRALSQDTHYEVVAGFQDLMTRYLQ